MCIKIEKESIFSSIQGLGSYGRQRFGINPRGAMDRTAVRIINILLGNPEGASTLELHFPAGEILFTEQCMFALGGADFAGELGQRTVEIWRTYLALPGEKLRFRNRTNGNRCYLAVKGGLKKPVPDRQPPGNELPAKLGRGDRLFPEVEVISPDHWATLRASPSIIPRYARFPTVRFLASGEFDRLDELNRRSLCDANFEISKDSDRMGFRLIGPEITLREPVELVSASVNFGTIQLLPNGQILVLMADHQTSGGYPRLGNIISTDLPLIAQLGAGDRVAFALTSSTEAERTALVLEADLRRLSVGVGFGNYW